MKSSGRVARGDSRRFTNGRAAAALRLRASLWKTADPTASVANRRHTAVVVGRRIFLPSTSRTLRRRRNRFAGTRALRAATGNHMRNATPTISVITPTHRLAPPTIPTLRASAHRPSGPAHYSRSTCSYIQYMYIVVSCSHTHTRLAPPTV